MDINSVINFFSGLVDNKIFLISISFSFLLIIIATSYKYIKAKKKDNIIRSISHEDGDFLKMSGYKHSDNFVDNSFTQTNEITEFDDERPNADIPRENQLIEEAKVFDSIDRKAEAIKSLSKAISKSTDINLKNKLKIVVREYSNSNQSLDFLLANLGMSNNVETIVERKSVIQPPQPVKMEDLFSEIKETAYKEDKDLGFLGIGTETNEDKLRFMSEFGEMIENKNKPKNDTVYVSWIQNYGGKTELKNGFFNLSGLWGNKKSVIELNMLIKKDISNTALITIISTILVDENSKEGLVWASWMQISGGKTTFKNASFKTQHPIISQKGISEINQAIKKNLEPNAFVAIISNVSME